MLTGHDVVWAFCSVRQGGQGKLSLLFLPFQLHRGHFCTGVDAYKFGVHFVLIKGEGSQSDFFKTRLEDQSAALSSIQLCTHVVQNTYRLYLQELVACKFVK